MIEIPLTKGYVTIVDDEDADLANFRWSAVNLAGEYYAGRQKWEGGKNRLYLMHRIILERKLGRVLEKQEFCDHINGNRMDNRRSELRLATPTQNTWNSRKSKANTTGYKGVWYDKRWGKYRAQIYHHRKKIDLGAYDTPEEAYEKYCEANKSLRGEFSRLD